ncbi:4-(cytidine 5'-diphospho)-2-C-methyl-D-erythritol kinase [Prevotella brunnea]|uniref:4-diphosphocytidyl-2-C-methyl-D-erythritol kinase n=1 Tax=Prevotella brunnea TaxID=2508867 RepID=A0A5C8GDA1_9BACT|nr:4-(cytidine 5'-diphospho)-2-C-methyl-D-erythritol kinase [Prevotella brunnea]TXJ59749.1 4-(cytidine 5'-diphospho)-2-C-methyl-D-erythritol kinase [Prevotella brunnea]
MILHPCCKINLGLNIVGKRNDGYHNLETVFYPVPLCDTLELIDVGQYSANPECYLEENGDKLDCTPQENLIVKAFKLLAKDFRLPSIRVKLTKRIPSQAGLGGGSSDAVYMLKLLNAFFKLNIEEEQLIGYAVRLGADCAFFIHSTPCFASGIGDKLTPLDSRQISLNGYHIAIIKPDIAISTKEAFSNIHPNTPMMSCEKSVQQPISEWKNILTNDFEDSIFPSHPALKEIKRELYKQGALYAQMSGSGSAIYGLFRKSPELLFRSFSNYFTFISPLTTL